MIKFEVRRVRPTMRSTRLAKRSRVSADVRSHVRNFWLLIVLGSLVLISAACLKPAEPDSVARISVLSSGEILLNGKPIEFAQLEQNLQRLKTEGGVVWYYRDNPAREPPPNAMAVLDLVMRNNLPISMSSQPDFSDYIDENGWAQKREP